MRTSCIARRTDENNEKFPDKHQTEEEMKRADTAGEFASHRAGCGRPGQDAPPRCYCYGGADDPIYVADSSNQDEVEDAKKKTVEVPQMHDINVIARRCGAEPQEGLNIPKA